jgi:uroporphyrin-3 C-methyltransferase
MSKKKSADKKEIVKPEVPDESVAAESTGPAEKAVVESNKPDDKSDEQDQSQAKSKQKSEVKPAIETAAEKPGQDTKPQKVPKASRGFPYFGVFNLLLIIGVVAAAGYYWQAQQKTELQKNKTIAALQAQIGQKADTSQLQELLSPLESGISNSVSQIGELQHQQQALQESTEKLYELYGRDESDWQLAEVEYLMRIAQHKLFLENDFEGAAITLQAASDKIAATGDPGLLSVRVQIGDEIAELKTRARPDLVGMTLLLSQLGKQLRSLKPGYQPSIETITEIVQPQAENLADQTIDEQVISFISSLVTVRKNEFEPTKTEALIVDVEEILETNLKLTRWTVLERDEFQYSQLMKENVEIFKQYYNLENAANSDFYNQLLELQKAEVKPQKPDISGSFEMLKRIISRRQQAPAEAGIQEGGDV